MSDAPAAPLDPKPHPLRSIYSANLPEILRQGGASLWITTYQAGKLIIARESEGTLNTHFRNFHRPTGLAMRSDRLALAAQSAIWLFDNIPEVGRKLEPVGQIDACYLARDIHITGAIDAHEMAFGGDELWIVNTEFSCLCTMQGLASFVPRWKPPFVSAITLGDRCHLNGLGMVEGRPRFVTALAQSDEANGWRSRKTTGGVLMDVTNNQVLAHGLCMPHSPRWYDGRLWVLESGAGRIGVVDTSSSKVNTVAELPGFTRGLDFVGRHAFIGLSQVRESATFAGLPLTQRLPEDQRWSGVVVVNIDSGQTVAFLRFVDAVQEIFAVQLLGGARFPDLINDDENILASSFRI